MPPHACCISPHSCQTGAKGALASVCRVRHVQGGIRLGAVVVEEVELTEVGPINHVPFAKCESSFVDMTPDLGMPGPLNGNGQGCGG